MCKFNDFLPYLHHLLTFIVTHRRPPRGGGELCGPSARFILELKLVEIMLHDVILLIIGLALIIFGGDWVTDGAESIARRFHVTPLVIGLTVVAFGSSTPDLVVSVTSTIEGKSQLAIGGVVGAVIFDALLVVGATALIRPVPTSRTMRALDLPMMAMAALILLFCGADKLIDGTGADIINRSDGLIMLCVFALFIAYTMIDARHSMAHATPATDSSMKPPMAMWRSVGMVIVGLAALVIGGRWIVDGASGVAKAAGMSEALIGLTIVAIGSSLPDLATSVIASIKGQAGIALGNVVGSCVIDILLVLGVCSTIAPLNAGTISTLDFVTLAVAAVVVWLFGTLGSRTLTRPMGAILVTGYVAYMVCLVMRG